jgi:hypothetical protein
MNPLFPQPLDSPLAPQMPLLPSPWSDAKHESGKMLSSDVTPSKRHHSPLSRHPQPETSNDELIYSANKSRRLNTPQYRSGIRLEDESLRPLPERCSSPILSFGSDDLELSSIEGAASSDSEMISHFLNGDDVSKNVANSPIIPSKGHSSRNNMVCELDSQAFLMLDSPLWEDFSNQKIGAEWNLPIKCKTPNMDLKPRPCSSPCEIPGPIGNRESSRSPIILTNHELDTTIVNVNTNAFVEPSSRECKRSEREFKHQLKRDLEEPLNGSIAIEKEILRAPKFSSETLPEQLIPQVSLGKLSEDILKPVYLTQNSAVNNAEVSYLLHSPKQMSVGTATPSASNMSTKSLHLIDSPEDPINLKSIKLGTFSFCKLVKDAKQVTCLVFAVKPDHTAAGFCTAAGKEIAPPSLRDFERAKKLLLSPSESSQFVEGQPSYEPCDKVQPGRTKTESNSGEIAFRRFLVHTKLSSVLIFFLF